MKKTGMSRAEVADTIERFVNGICSRRDWEEFCAWPIVDPHLDSIRLRCRVLPQEFPPCEKRHYCSPTGIEVLRRIVIELRAPRNPNSPAQ